MRWRRSGELFVAVASVGLTAATAIAIRPAGAPAGVLLLVAVAWGAVSYVCEFGLRSSSPARASSRRSHGLTTVVRLGEESDAVARVSIVLAADAGPAVVVATRDRPLLAELSATVGVDVYIASTMEAALVDALPSITTDAIFIVSASAFPLADGCATACSLLGGDVGWAVGRTSSLNDDRYAPAERDELRSGARTRARRAGADVWEPDATIVRTDLVRGQSFESRTPWGTWLRQQRRDGFRGVETPALVARRSAPADAPAFWPSELMRRRAAAADLAAATRVGPARARLAALGALGRELFGYPIVCWMAVPLVIAVSGRFPLRFPPLPYLAAVAAVAAARWVTTRAAYGIGFHPMREARAAAYEAPSSLFALPSVITGRVRRIRLRIPDQPLLVAAVILTLLTTLVVVDRGTADPHVAHLAAAVAIAELVVMWALAVRAVGKRAWERASYRVPVHLDARIDNRQALVLDASSLGIAVTGDLPEMSRETSVAVSISCPDGAEIGLRGVVKSQRQTRSGPVLGLALEADPETRARWIVVLISAQASRRATAMREPRSNIDRLVSLELAAVGVVAALALALLLIIGFGYRPLIVRSASMVPALQVGDMVVVQPVRADQLHRGDVVTLPNGTGELLTHRVTSVTPATDALRIETRGDANRTSEYFTRPPRALVGRVAVKIPLLGRAIVALGAQSVRWILGLVCAALVVVAALTSTPLRPLQARTRKNTP